MCERERERARSWMRRWTLTVPVVAEGLRGVVRDRLHFNHWRAKHVPEGWGGFARGCFELTGTHSVPSTDHPPNPIFHGPLKGTIPTVAYGAFRSFRRAFCYLHRPRIDGVRVHPDPTPSPSPFRPFRIQRNKKNAQEFFYRFHREAYFSLFFFSPFSSTSPRPRPCVVWVFFHPRVTSPPSHRVQTPRFFPHTGQSEGRGQGEKSASRARPGGDSANHLSKQDRLFLYSVVYFYFISHYASFFSFFFFI